MKGWVGGVSEGEAGRMPHLDTHTWRDLCENEIIWAKIEKRWVGLPRGVSAAQYSPTLGRSVVAGEERVTWLHTAHAADEIRRALQA